MVIGEKEGREKAIGTQGGVNKPTFPPIINGDLFSSES